MFIGFKNHVCINLCISTDGFLDDLRVMSVQKLFNRVFQLLTRFDAERQIKHLSTLSDYTLTEHQFAQLVGKSRLYQFLPPKIKKALDTVTDPDIKQGEKVSVDAVKLTVEVKEVFMIKGTAYYIIYFNIILE